MVVRLSRVSVMAWYNLFSGIVKSAVVVRRNYLVTCSVVTHLRHRWLQVEYEVGLVKSVLLEFTWFSCITCSRCVVNAVEV